MWTDANDCWSRIIQVVVGFDLKKRSNFSESVVSEEVNVIHRVPNISA